MDFFSGPWEFLLLSITCNCCLGLCLLLQWLQLRLLSTAWIGRDFKKSSGASSIPSFCHGHLSHEAFDFTVFIFVHHFTDGKVNANYNTSSIFPFTTVTQWWLRWILSARGCYTADLQLFPLFLSATRPDFKLPLIISQWNVNFNQTKKVNR